MKRNPAGPWNPADPLKITPEEYEREVLDWLSKTGARNGIPVEFSHQRVVRGHGGAYTIDVTGEFSILGGALVKILVECKRHQRPVERSDMLTFAAKVRDTASHKGMMFSTAGFQRGALEFAKSKGIASITFVNGHANYQTRSLEPTHTPPLDIEFPKYGGFLVTLEASVMHTAWVAVDELGPIAQWIHQDISVAG